MGEGAEEGGHVTVTLWQALSNQFIKHRNGFAEDGDTASGGQQHRPLRDAELPRSSPAASVRPACAPRVPSQRRPISENPCTSRTGPPLKQVPGYVEQNRPSSSVEWGTHTPSVLQGCVGAECIHGNVFVGYKLLG